MEIMQKGKLPNGTNIQIEDWSKDYSFKSYGSTIAAYPISNHSLDGQFSPKKGRSFRFQLDFKNYEEAQEAFKKLVSGERTLKDYSSNFRGNEEEFDCI